MRTDQRVQLCIGSLTIQICALQAQVDELKSELAKLRPPEEQIKKPDGNGVAKANGLDKPPPGEQPPL
jgi:hypothetical protein